MGGIVLAGGRSARMGQDKALLKIDGVTLLERAVATMRQVTQEVVVVADRTDRYSLPGVPCCADAYPDTGPLGGLVTGLTASGPGWHLVAACDLPALQTALLLLLLEEAGPAWDAVVPEVGGQLEPLCAIYCDTAAAPLAEYLQGGGRAVHKALAGLRLKRLEESLLRRADPQLRSFCNLNTPEDFAAFDVT